MADRAVANDRLDSRRHSRSTAHDASPAAFGEAPASPRGETVFAIAEDVLGCKWTLHILDQISRGVRRPGALRRSLPGLTTKVLNERLRKLVRFGLIERRTYPERLLHVEYFLTPFGERFSEIVEQLAALEQARLTGRD